MTEAVIFPADAAPADAADPAASPGRHGGLTPRRGSRAVKARGAATAVLALSAAGCASFGAAAPEVGVERVELRGLGLLDQSLGVTLCVSNPNDAELVFRRVGVVLEVAGAPLAEGASEAPVRLPPRSSVPVPFAVATTTRNLGPQLLDVLLAGGVEYRLRGSVQLGGALALTVPFDRSGRLDPVTVGRGMLASGRRLLADAAVLGGSRCAPAAAP